MLTYLEKNMDGIKNVVTEAQNISNCKWEYEQNSIQWCSNKEGTSH